MFADRFAGPPHLVLVGDQPSSSVTDRESERTRETHYVANIKSQIKRNRTNEKARVRNQAVKTALKTEIRRVRTAVAEGDKDAAEEALRVASRRIDKAVSKGVVHKNQAANRKSNLAKQVNAL